MNNLQLSNLHKSFGANSVLAGLDLDVPAGSLTAILGPSGSGKTTLLRLLAGFEHPDRGTIRIGASVLDAAGTHVHPEHRRIGYVPQEGGLFPHLTVEANVVFGLSRVARRQGAADLLELIGLTDLARRYPTSSPAANSSASRWPVPSRSNPRWCCWTSRSRRSTRTSV
jgi:iron(III) transport system ATP-binding protein